MRRARRAAFAPIAAPLAFALAPSLSLALSSCTERAANPAGDAVGRDSVADGTAAARPSLPDLLAGVHERTPGGRLPVLDRLPPPREIRKRPVTNRHDPAVTDTLATLVYPGLRVEVYRVATSGKEIVRSIEVTGRQHRAEEGVGPGSARGEVIRAFGEPDTVDGSTLVYHRTDEEHDPTPTTLSIRLASDGVERMTWSYYVD